MKVHFRRFRRIRNNIAIRELVAETALVPSQLVLPMFVLDGSNKAIDIDAFPGVKRYSIDMLPLVIDRALSVGIRSFVVFPYVEENKKSDQAEEAYNPDNLICRCVSEIKRRYGKEILIITDVAADPYTTSGHDGIFHNGDVLNDETLELLIKQSLVQAAAGSDVLAPSDMMDGRVLAIRNALDLANMQDISILAYSVKYASNLYSPFRSAVGVGSTVIDKRTYQMDYRNSNEAMKEIEQDILEGADMVMIKPAGLFLDVIYRASERFDVPLFAYQVSGEFKMFKEYGGISMLLESVLSIKRAGATAIFTYGAIELADFILAK